jgi:DNA-binding NarL/FixJ family response regulator
MGRKPVNLVAVFSVEPDQYRASRTLSALIKENRMVPGPEGWAVLHECCAKADLVLMAVCDEKDGVLGAIRARAQNSGKRLPYNLTPHELRLLDLMVKGHSYKTAASKLGVSVNTVAFHMQNIYSKLNVHSKSAAVALALSEGLLQGGS